MNRTKQLFNSYKTPILYSGGSLTKSLAQLVVGFVVAKFVSPEDYGLWTTLSLTITYSAFLQAGLINGLNLELPLSLGKGNKKQAKLMAGSMQTITLISSSLVLLSGLSYFLFTNEENPKIYYGMLAISLVIAFTFYQNYLLSTFRSKNSFLILSFLQIFHAVVNLSTIILVVYFSYYGMIIKSATVLFVYVLLLHLYRPFKIGLIWNLDVLKKLFKVGFPIFGLAYIVSISSTVDKLWLLKFSDLETVGLYSFGYYAFTTFVLFSSSIASYVYPRMTYSYGKNKDKTILWKYVKRITLLLLVMQIPLACIGYYLVPTVISTHFPKYIESTYVIQILLFAGVFKGSVVGVNALWSMKKWKYMIFYQVFYSLLLISLTYAGTQVFLNKIVGVAYGVLVANALNLISGYCLTFAATMDCGKKNSL